MTDNSLLSSLAMGQLFSLTQPEKRIPLVVMKVADTKINTIILCSKCSKPIYCICLPMKEKSWPFALIRGIFLCVRKLRHCLYIISALFINMFNCNKWLALDI